MKLSPDLFGTLPHARQTAMSSLVRRLLQKKAAPIVNDTHPKASGIQIYDRGIDLRRVPMPDGISGGLLSDPQQLLLYLRGRNAALSAHRNVKLYMLALYRFASGIA